LSNSIVGLVAQRLLRVLCVDCRESYTPNDAECDLLDVDKANPPSLFRAVGCEKCANEGYRGRQGIYEVVTIDDEMRRMIHTGSSEMELERHARTKSTSIREDAIAKVLTGVTSIHELLRVTTKD
jgi:general secretion pathway protein E